MAKKRAHVWITSLFVFVLLFTQTINVFAAGVEYAGELQLFGDSRHMGINMYASYLADADDTHEYIHVNYKGSGGSRIGIATFKDYGYDGRLEIYQTFTRQGEPITDATASYLEYWMSDVSAPDGITLTAHIAERTTDSIKIRYILEFDNYVSKSSSVHISFTDNFSQDFYAVALENPVTMTQFGQLFYTLSCTQTDWAGSLLEYRDPTEMNGAEWQSVTLLDRIRDEISEFRGDFTFWLNTIETRIVDGFTNLGTRIDTFSAAVAIRFNTLLNKMDSQHQAQLEQDQAQHQEQLEQDQTHHEEQLWVESENFQIEQEAADSRQDELLHGFDEDTKQSMDDVNLDCDYLTETLNDSENYSFDASMELMGSFDISDPMSFSDFLLYGIGTSSAYIQSIFNASGSFAIVISIFMTLTILCNLLCIIGRK